jgi:Protein of unknown function (DUF3570)
MQLKVWPKFDVGGLGGSRAPPKTWVVKGLAGISGQTLNARAAAAALACAAAWPAAAVAGGSSLTAHASAEVAGYSDTDHVAVLTPNVSGRVENPTAGWSAEGSYLVDFISAASVDIVSTASSRWTEVRHAGALSGTYKPHDLGLSVKASISDEPDYLAYAAGGYVTADFDERNISVIFGYAYGHDTIGRTGTPFSVFSHDLERHTITAGLTSDVDRLTVLGLGAELEIDSGDPSKPYRYIPLFSPAVAPTIPRGASLQLVTQLRLPDRPREQLPLSRARFAATARLARRFPRATVQLEGRAYDDSWQLGAFSSDLRLLFDVGSRWSIGPHARYYVQSGASFWKLAYVGTADHVPALRTGDRELSPLTNLTGGAALHWRAGPASRPDALIFGLSGDVTYTAFFAALYVRERVASFAALTTEVAW